MNGMSYIVVGIITGLLTATILSLYKKVIASLRH